VFDIKWIRDNPQAFDAGLKKRGIAPGGEVKFAAELLALDDERRQIITALQHYQAQRNAASKEIGKAKAAKDEDKARALMAEVADLKDALEKGDKDQKAADKALHDALSVIPNLPADDVPEGADEKGNKEIRKVGTAPKLGWTNKPLQHFEIGEVLGLMDFETAAKLSGARFVVLKGQMARLERALAAFMLDIHTAPEQGGIGGYTEIAPPLMVRDDVMYGTAQLPKFHDDQFVSFSEPTLSAQFLQSLEQHNHHLFRYIEMHGIEAAKKLVSTDIALIPNPNRYWLIPTAEVPLTNLVRESIRDEAELPIRVTAYTPCFRAEAGAAGKDTRGMIRQHQFSKVELVSITTPEQSAAEHERMTACAEEVLKRLGLAYRTMLLCTGDMGFAARKTYDIEVWLPGQNTYREISSCSVCGDFQARRMNARYKPKGAKETRFLHTLNGSGLAVGRTLIAILENYQQADGSVAIPDALVPYMGGVKRIEKA
jgi:seryl-tRNA synthetase